jgi:hypothetical protein
MWEAAHSEGLKSQQIRRPLTLRHGDSLPPNNEERILSTTLVREDYVEMKEFRFEMCMHNKELTLEIRPAAHTRRTVSPVNLQLVSAPLVPHKQATMAA